MGDKKVRKAITQVAVGASLAAAGVSDAIEVDAMPPQEVIERSSDEYSSHLVIGDTHVGPGQDLSRITLLGKMIAKLQPKVIICVGDWADVIALCSYDMGTRAAEGRRYLEDILWANRALKLLEETIKKYAPADYNPRKVYCLGNHENRINRETNKHPYLEDVLQTNDIEFAKYGWEVYDYRQPAIIDGIYYMHDCPSGAMGRPIGGVTIGRSLVTKTLGSVTVGHDHRFNHYCFQSILGFKKHGCSVGYYGIREDYAGLANNLFHKGILFKRHVKDGDYSPHWYDYPLMIKEFSNIKAAA